MKSTKLQRAVLQMAVITSFMIAFTVGSMSLAVPHMEVEFNVNAALGGWVISAYIITIAAMSIPFGKIADAKGRKKVLVIGCAGFAAASIFCACSMQFPVLLLARILQGFFAAMLFATNNAILVSVYPLNMRGRVLGVSLAATYIGSSIGPVISGFLIQYMGWRSIFVITGVLAFIAFVISMRGIPKAETEKMEGRPDILGNILYMVAIVIALYGLTNLSVMKFAWLIFVLGIVIGIVFVMVERKAENPVVRISMFTKSKAFTFSNLAALLNYGATYAISYLVSIYLQVVQGYDSKVAGLMMISMPLLQAIFTPYMGRLSDRVKPYKLASLGMGICAVSLVMMACINVSTSIWFMIIAMAIAGFSFALFSSPNTNAVLSLVSKDEYSFANSTLATMRTVGQSTSMAIVTIVVGVTLGNVSLELASAEGLIKTMRVSFVVFVVLCLVGMFLSLQRRKES